MKTLFAVVVSFALAVAAQAQFTQGPVCLSACTNSDVIVIAGATTSNLPIAMVKAFGIGRTGLGLGASVAGTNAATTTNTIVTVELSANGTEYFLNNRLTAGLPATGTGFSPFYTNWVPTTVNLDNAIFARIRSIQNTNIDSIFITNLYFNTR